jgi:PAS domain S-box-containing protein
MAAKKKETSGAMPLDTDVRRLAAIVESSADAVFSKDIDGTIRTWNRGTERLFGYTQDEAVGQSVEILIPADRASEFATIMTRLKLGENIEQLETERIRKDGQRVSVSLTISPVRDANGEVVSASVISRDNTERKRAEVALRESEKRLAEDLAGMARIQEVSRRLVQAGDTTSLLLEIVDAAIATTAADMGNIQLLEHGSGALKIVASRGFERPFLDFFNAVRAGQAACGTALKCGERVVIEDVTTSPVFAGSPDLEALLSAGVRAVQTTPLVGRSGRLVGMLSTHSRAPRRPTDRDLHLLDLLARQAADWIERTEAEEALRRSEERFRLLADAAPVLIWMSGTDKLCTWFNKPWLDFVGRPMEQELGNGWAENIHADDSERCLQTYNAAFDARQPFSMEYRLKRHDGKFRWLLDNGVPLYGPDGGFAGYIGSCIDITERREAEESVAATYRQLKLAMSAARMAAWTWDPQKDIASNTENFPEIYGLSSVAGIEEGMAMVHPEDRSRHRETVAHAVEHVTPYHSLFRIIRPDNGAVVWLDERAVPVMDRDGRFIALSGVVVDVTERKLLEREIVEAASLEQRRIGQDLHDSVAQELTALSLLARDLAETLRSDPAKAPPLVERLEQGLQRSQRELRVVLRGLLPVAVDSEGLMAALADLAGRTQQEGKVHCEFDCPEPVAVADNLTATHLYLVAQEAVHNAVKHAQPRVIRITLRTDEDLNLSVEDDGVGMPSQPAEHEGLGLRIMRNRAAIIGVRLTIEPAKPTGTVVRCVLARKNHEPRQEEASPGADRR